MLRTPSQLLEVPNDPLSTARIMRCSVERILQMKDWKVCGKRRPRPILRYYTSSAKRNKTT